MTEIFRFASRWTRRLSLGPQVRIEVDVFGPKGRNLDSLDAPGVRFSLPKVGYDASFRFAEDFDPERLIGSADDLAMVPTRRLFELFAWDVPEENLVERQRRLLQRA